MRSRVEDRGQKAAARFFFLALAAGICLGLSGCGAPAGKRQGAKKNEQGKNVAAAIAEAEFPTEPVYKNEEERWEAERDRRVPDAFTAAYEAFACETASELLKGKTENISYSPVSLYFALAMSAKGAGGETRGELLQALGYLSVENLSADCKAAYDALYRAGITDASAGTQGAEGQNAGTQSAGTQGAEGRGFGMPSGGAGELNPQDRYALQISNSLWADESVKVKEMFAGHVSRYFYSDVYTADLGREETARAMADWVERRTNGLIRPKMSPEPEKLLAVLNTIYFYDEWADRFDKNATAPGQFRRADGSEVACDFMNRKTSSHGFTRGENYLASSLSLKNGAVDFYLPDEDTDVKALAENPKTLQAMLDGDGERFMGQVTWKVPKFSMGSRMSLKETLMELGVKRAFDGGAADFSGMTDSDVFLSDVFQETHVAINEEGVEAAAFTQISYTGAALPSGSAEMILDRPFLYVIKNRGQILFIGICENPAKE